MRTHALLLLRGVCLLLPKGASGTLTEDPGGIGRLSSLRSWPRVNDPPPGPIMPQDVHAGTSDITADVGHCFHSPGDAEWPHPGWRTTGRQ